MKPSLFQDLIRVIRRHKGRATIAVLVMTGANLLQIVIPLIFRHAVTRLDESVEVDPGIVSQWLTNLQGTWFESAFTWGAILVGVAIASAILRYGTRMLFIGISRDAELELRETVFGKIQQHGQAFYDKHRIGDLMSRLTNDVSTYRQVVGPGVMYPVHFVTIVFPTLVALFFIAPLMAAVGCIPIIILPPIMVLGRGLLYETSIQVQAALGDMSTLAQENFSAIRLIKSYVRENAFAKRFRELCDRFRRLSLKLANREQVFYPSIGVIGKLVTVALIGLSGVIILGGYTNLTAADVVSFMWLQSYILLPTGMLGWIIPTYQRGRGAYQRLLEIYNEPLEVKDQGEAAVGKEAPRIILEDVSFSYTGETLALQHVTIEVHPGEMVGITGPPGSGKTTLFKLLLRDYEVRRGKVALEGKDVKDYALKELREALATVEQEPLLFSKSLRENIALGKEEATQEEIDQVTAAAQLTETVAMLPNGYETQVGERGVTLSGGQKQRVALARALLTDAPVMLLDDVFSALDAQTADQVFQVLEGMKGKKTIVLITHRVSILKRMDRVVTMAKGEIDEVGTPEELEKRGGHFAALVELDRLIQRRGER